jgi:hypothetical protein
MCWKRWKKRSNGAARQWGWCAAISAILLSAASVAAVDKISDLQARFDKETHASGKVKALDKVTDAQFDETRKASAAGDYVNAGLIFEKYRDNVRACLELLKKQQTRRGLREIEDTLVTAPPDVRPPLEIVRKDILDMDDELIRLLFPKRTPDPEKVPAVPEAKP